jgi:hypothetical protein
VPDDPGPPGGRLAAAVAELYGVPPESFTGRRGELAAAARSAGDRAAAQAIGALRRPTRSAWVVNTLARANPDAASKLAGMAVALRAAQQAGDGRRLRELSAQRDALIDGLTAQALAAADVTDAPPSLRLEITETLTAALADPGVAADFAAGTLTRAMQWSGFGVLPADTGPDTGSGGDATGPPEQAVPAQRRAGTKRQPPDDNPGTATASRSRNDASPAAAGAGPPAKAAGPAPVRRATRAAAANAAPAPAGATPGTAAAPAAGRRQTREAERAAQRQAREAERAAQRQAAEAERAAREAAERAAQRRAQYAEAEQAMTAASAAATEAVAAEDRLESAVRDLEERLGRARADLETTRLRARRAEAAERRARQALGRLPRELPAIRGARSRFRAR